MSSDHVTKEVFEKALRKHTEEIIDVVRNVTDSLTHQIDTEQKYRNQQYEQIMDSLTELRNEVKAIRVQLSQAIAPEEFQRLDKRITRIERQLGLLK